MIGGRPADKEAIVSVYRLPVALSILGDIFSCRKKTLIVTFAGTATRSRGAQVTKKLTHQYLDIHKPTTT